MFSCVYVSASVQELGAAELAALLTEFRSKNDRSDVTGLLLYKNGRFIQALEGPEEVVRALMSKIRVDPKHDHVRVLMEGPIDARLFPTWSMGYQEVPGPAPDGVAGFNGFLSGHAPATADAGSRANLLLEWFRSQI